jgi:D-alanyl-D-alanine carboxypeptidase (penicillin-binding protein 5/6)
MPRRLAAAFLATALITLSASAGVAAATPQQVSATIGGPLLATGGVVVGSGAPPLPAASELPASSWMVANLTTGEVLAAKAPHEKFLPASTLKMLTAATLIPRLNPNATTKVSYHDEVVDGTKAGLTAGMHYKISTLFQCMLEMSANDAAEALAHAFGGVKETLVAMNAEARVLQANDTHADTPSGLDGPGETTSAYDLALIAQNNFKDPAFQHYITQLSSEIPAPHHKHFQIQSHNNLLYYYKGDIGGKNGYTVAANATYVGAATRHGQTIVVSLMHAYPQWWPMAARLLSWGFKATGKATPVGTLVQPLPPPPLPVTHPAIDIAKTVVAAPTHRATSAPLIETLVVMATAFGAGMFALRRLIPSRRRSSLSLPTT